jgi:CIC family chloride channel protein
LDELVVMKDIATRDVIATTPQEDLNTVLRKFTRKNNDSLPVVDQDDRTRLLGMLNRRSVIDFYNRSVNELKSATV